MHRFPKSDLEKYKDVDGASAELFFDVSMSFELQVKREKDREIGHG